MILIGGAINAVLQEFTDPRAAKAGANKAAAKVLVENPELDKAARAKAVADKKAETLATLSKTNDGNDIETENAGSDTQTEKDNPKKISDDSDNGAKPKVEKSKLKLIAGLLIGFVSNLRKK